MEKNYYAVNVKCGHVGCHNYTIKEFAVEAEDAKQAARIARKFPRVKHHRKDTVLGVKKITKERYDEIFEEHRNDPYFICGSNQEQRELCPDLVIYADEPERDDSRQRADRNSRRNVFCGKTKVRNPKKFRNFSDFGESYAAYC